MSSILGYCKICWIELKTRHLKSAKRRRAALHKIKMSIWTIWRNCEKAEEKRLLFQTPKKQFAPLKCEVHEGSTMHFETWKLKSPWHGKKMNSLSQSFRSSKTWCSCQTVELLRRRSKRWWSFLVNLDNWWSQNSSSKYFGIFG